MMCPFRGEEGLFSRLVEPWGSAPAGPGIVHGYRTCQRLILGLPGFSEFSGY